MSDSFSDFLCKKEALVDISKSGIATQSSTSQQSKKNDAKRAIDGTVAADYVFHTGNEKCPWWQVDFESVILPYYIIINNRKHHKWRDNSSSIEVSVINENGKSVTIHKGLLYFGSSPESLPLILPLNGKIKIKSIRISINDKPSSYLHLGSIRILAKPSTDLGRGNKPIFIANRNDGLGERLKAIINGLLLAANKNGSFLYTWPSDFSNRDFHAIDKVEKIFSESFIKNHLIDESVIQKRSIKPLREIVDFDKESLEAYDEILVQQTYLLNQLKNSNSDIKNLNFKELSIKYRLAYNEIEFSKEVEDACDLAKSINLKEKVLAIHFRSGDLVHTHFRFMDRYYGKVVPLYAIGKAIEKYQGMGYDVVLFGQDTKVCKFLKVKYNIFLSNDLTSNKFNDVQQAMFDITLMSRCKEILCGSSGFAVLASWIGGVIVSDYKDCLSEKEIRFSLFDELKEGGALSSDSTTSLLKSFSISHFIHSHNNLLSLEEQIFLFEECIRLDPNNNYYKLTLACLFYSNSDIEKGDSIMISLFLTDGQYNLDWIAYNKFPDGTTTLLRFVPLLKRVMSHGSGIAAMVVLLHEYYYENRINDEAYELAKKKSKSLTDAIGRKSLEKISGLVQ